ncbi:hypothetical protein FZEAL_2206 [Fusarium zealandicum]|uniref:Uncharacterized protein n=1 Tax=Fusarium zealandicum TaxID=1053134 RepID=A0A8H4URV6_9HYPO|nr:hypothetical protein FZEAL_2206 [Fusarium zealandicum]
MEHDRHPLLTFVLVQFRRKIFSSSKSRRASDGPLDAGTPPGSHDEPAESSKERSKSVGSESVTSDGAPDDGSPSVATRDYRSSSIDSIIAPSSLTSIASTGKIPDPQGLSILHTPDDERAADIIFVHGLGGSSKGTWCKKLRPDTFWPEQWLPKDEDVRHARIFTFGYNARFRSSNQSSVLGINDFSNSLLYDMLFATDLQGRPLHLGQAYLDAQLDTRYATVMKSTKAVVFLSTPHRGSDFAPYLNRLLSISLGSTLKQYISELTEDSSFLRTVNEQFRCDANGLEIFSFYETLQTPIGMSSVLTQHCIQLIVDPESAKLGYPGEVSRSLNADHPNVCKFEDIRDPNYRVVVGALKSLVSTYQCPPPALYLLHLPYTKPPLVHLIFKTSMKKSAASIPRFWMVTYSSRYYERAQLASCGPSSGSSTQVNLRPARFRRWISPSRSRRW